MSGIVHLFVYFCFAGVGGVVGSKLKIPAGAMLGAMLSVIMAKTLLKFDWELPKNYSFVLQILLGVMLASSFHPTMLKTFHQKLFPIVISTFTLVIAGIFLAWIFTRLGILDISTAYLGTSPGAMSSLILLASEAQANAPLITCFHFFRLLVVILIAPFVLKYLAGIPK